MIPSTRALFGTLVERLPLNGVLPSLVAKPSRCVHGHVYPLVLCVCMFTAGCSNLLKADFQSYAAGAPPAGLPPGSGALLTTLLPGSPAGDSLGVSGHGGGTYNIVTSAPPAGNKGLEIGGVAAGGVCLSSAASLVTVPLTRSNYEVRKPVSFAWDVQSSGAGNFGVEVLGKIPGSDPNTSGWRVLLHFAIRDGELAELLSSTQRAPSGFSTVTTATGGRFKVFISIDERSNRWTASFVLPTDVSRPQGMPASTLPQLRGELRPELNFLNVPPEALSLRLALSDRACVKGTSFSYVVDNVQVGQYRPR